MTQPARKPEPVDDDVLTVPEVAELLRIGRDAVYDGVARNRIPHWRIGKHIRFSRAAIMRTLAAWSTQVAKEG